MLPQWIIEKKRDGMTLPDDDIRSFIAGYAAGDIPDYQMSALAMAIYFNGMSFAETAVLADAMMKSGEVLNTSSIRLPKIDKHSTGGVGDKVSLVLAPLVACCDIAVPMIAGRGLGITGGTIDKLESIPGYRTNLSSRGFLAVLKKCGCSIIGQTAQLAPADKKLYALRDVTGTVQSIPLISASIMSKKLAEGIDSLVLDIKCGKGAFMTTLDMARELARTMIKIGTQMKKGMAAVITDMNQPLGRAAGNSLEVIEAIEALQGRGPRDLVNVTMELGAHMLLLGKRAKDARQAKEILRTHIDSGAGYEKFKEMVRLHGGKVAAIENTEKLPQARIKRELPSPRKGFVAEVDAELIGKACIVLGAGRRKASDSIDPAAGLAGIVKIGERVEKKQPLLTIHANTASRLAESLPLIKAAFKLSSQASKAPRLIIETLCGPSKL